MELSRQEGEKVGNKKTDLGGLVFKPQATDRTHYARDVSLIQDHISDIVSKGKFAPNAKQAT